MGQTVVRPIEYTPLSSQLRFHTSAAKIKGFCGPVGSGKSQALAHEIIKLSVENAGLDGLLGAPTYRMLEDVTKRSLLEVLSSNSIPHQHSRSDNRIALTDLGTTIFCRSMEDPSRLVGSNLAFAGVDELTFCKSESFLRLLARLRHPRASRLCCACSFTPRGFDFYYDHFVGDRKTSDYELIRASPRENIHLPDGYYDTLARTYDPRFFRQECLGEFLSLTSGTAYSAFDRALNVDSGIIYNPCAQLIVTADYNIDPMSWLIGQIVDFAPTIYTSTQDTRRLEILQESIIRDSTINAACSALIDRIKNYRRPSQRLTIHFYGDASGHNRTRAGDTDYSLIKQFFARHDEYELVWHVPTGNPTVRDRVNTVNALLQNAAGATRLTIHPTCRALIKDLERMTWAQDTNGNSLDGLSKKDKMLGHASDALGYCVYREFPLRGGDSGFQSGTRIV